MYDRRLLRLGRRARNKWAKVSGFFFSRITTRQSRVTLYILHLAIVCAILLSVEFISPRPALALDPSLDISQYAHTAWKVRDGFIQSGITAIAQTPDSYLWLGTEFGLYRFDGVRAVAWQPPAGEQLPSNNIRGLLVARDGTLWIRTVKGLASWKDGKFTQYPEVAGQYVGSILQDRQGTIWFGVRDPSRLCAIQAGKVQCYGRGSFGLGISFLYEDHKGNLWLAASNGLWRWAPGTPEHYTIGPVPSEVSKLIQDDDGTLLLATSNGLKQFASGKIQNYTLPGVAGQFRPTHFLRSSDGSLWVGTQQSLLRLHQGRTDVFGASDGLTGDLVSSIFEDSEGNIWVSTRNGLDRFREYAIPSISRSQGLSTAEVYSTQATPDGTIWIGTPNGLNRWRDGHFTVYGRRTTAGPISRREDGELITTRAVSDATKSALAGSSGSLGLDDQGRLWVSTADGVGVFYFEGGRFIRLPGVAVGVPSSGIARGGHGKVWISGNAGLSFVTPGKAVESIPWSRLGHQGLGARALLPDPLQGGVWLGFVYEGGLVYFKDGQVRVSYGAADGLAGWVNDLRFGSRGTLWAATEGGLSRIKNGKIATLTSKNGLPCDTVHWTMEDDDHFLWLYMPCGLVRIARSELDAWAGDPSRKLKLTMFDSSDGVRSVGLLGGYGPHVTKSPDGKIWFASPEGVSVIDPRHLPFNKRPPPVHIEQITADRKVYDASNGLRLPPLVRDLEIDYTALSLMIPEKNRFRVKLEPYDRDWQDAGNRRQAFYSNLPPRSYRFRVIASNNSGVWNEEGTFLDFSIAPAYYQTKWFQALCLGAFVALLGAFYRFRLYQIHQQFNAGLEARVNERNRIARELHDTLLQSFQGLVFRFQAARNQLPDRPEEASETLDSALISADRALEEGRSSIQELRSEVLKESNMEQVLLAMGRQLASSQNGEYSSPPLRVIVEGTRRAKRAMIREEIYRIARELLRNAYRHAQARRIEAELRYEDDVFVLIVRDDGKGIDPEVLKEHGRAGHWGLPGLYERAEGIGARLDVWSEAGAGTEVRLTVPGATTYEKSGHGGRFKLFRKKKRNYEHGS